jgi:hypothetical protein
MQRDIFLQVTLHDTRLFTKHRCSINDIVTTLNNIRARKVVSLYSMSVKTRLA